MSLSLLVLIPTFNDWETVEPLLSRLDLAVKDQKWMCDVLLLDDGSTEALVETLHRSRYQALNKVSVLHLNRNIGHQRAIADIAI